MRKRVGNGLCIREASPDIEARAASVFSLASAETERRDGSLPRTRLTGLFVALLEDVDTILRRGPIKKPLAREGYKRERAQAYEEAILWAQGDVGAMTLSEVCEYLRTQGLSANEHRIRRIWAKVIKEGGARALRSEQSRSRAPVLHVLGASTTQSD